MRPRPADSTRCTSPSTRTSPSNVALHRLRATPQLADEYRRTLDPLVSLAAAATATERIRLGTGIALPAQREPIVTAKAIATLDQLSGGRFVFGIGFGWNEDELENHGVTMKDRRDVVRERVLAMKALWTDDVAGYRGKFVDDQPQLVMAQARAATTPAGADRRCRRAEDVRPHRRVRGRLDPDRRGGLTKALPELRAVVEEAGRDPSDLEIVPFGSIPDQGKLDHFTEIGVTECVLRIPSGARDDVLPVARQVGRAAGGPNGSVAHRRSRMVTLAWPPPSHMVCRP